MVERPDNFVTPPPRKFFYFGSWWATLPLRQQTLHNTWMTSIWGQLWNGWANSNPPPPSTRAVVHIDMRSSDRTQVYCRKGWSTWLWVGLKGAIPGMLIPGEKMVESLLGIMRGAWAG